MLVLSVSVVGMVQTLVNLVVVTAWNCGILGRVADVGDGVEVDDGECVGEVDGEETLCQHLRGL